MSIAPTFEELQRRLADPFSAPARAATAAATGSIDAPPPEAILTAAQVWEEMANAWWNEDPNGQPVHFPTIAPHWSWMPGEVTLVTGWPGHGKSELMLQLMLTKSVYEGWKWGLYCPENMPARKLVSKLVQSYVGQTANPKTASRMSFAQYEDAAGFILEHFHVINPRLVTNVPKLLQVFKRLIDLHGIKGGLTDPWNALESNLKAYGGREDEMLKDYLNQVLDFAEDNEQCSVICAHPSGEARTKDLALRVPDQYSVSGGRMWANKVDNFLVVHRPYADDEPTNTAVDFYARKIKQEGLVGIKTPKEGVRLNYERGTFRYIDSKIGQAPLDIAAVERFRKFGTNELQSPLPTKPSQDVISFPPLPQSKFDEPTPF
jgi:hypothetical protein